MTLPQLLKKYKLDIKQLKRKLEEAEIEYGSFKYIRTVPDEWLALVGDITTIESKEAKTKKQKSQPLIAFEQVEKKKSVSTNPFFLADAKVAVIKKKLDGHGFLRIVETPFIGGLYPAGKSNKDCVFYYKDEEIEEGQLVLVEIKTIQSKTKAVLISTHFYGISFPTKISYLTLLHPFFDSFPFSKPDDLLDDDIYDINRFRITYFSKKNFYFHERRRHIKNEFPKIQIVASQKIIPNQNQTSRDLKFYFERIVKKRKWNEREFIIKVAIGLLIKQDLEESYFRNIRLNEYNQIPLEKRYDALGFLLKEWEYIRGQPLPFQEIIKNTELNEKEYLELWGNGYAPLPESNEEKLDLFQIGLSFLNNQSNDFAEKILNKIQAETEIEIEKILSEIIASIESISESNELNYYQNLIGFSDNIDFSEQLNQKAVGKTYIDLWLNGDIKQYNFEKIKTAFFSCESALQEEILDSLQFDEIKVILQNGKENKLQVGFEWLAYKFKKHLYTTISTVAFDLEIRGERLKEIGIKQGTGKEFEIKDENAEIEESILELFCALNASEILVGHNIEKFDLPWLKKYYNYESDFSKLWDTMKIEVILSPSLTSHALNTNHTALEDSKKSLELFENQLIRIVLLGEKSYGKVTSFLPESILPFISQLRSFNHLVEDTYTNKLNDEKTKFLHQKRVNPLTNYLEQYILQNKIQNAIIIAPEILLRSLTSNSLFNFPIESFRFYNTVLNPEKVNEKYREEEYVGVALSTYIETCLENNETPRFHKLAPYLKSVIKKEMDFMELCDDLDLPVQVSAGIWCVNAFFLKEKPAFFSNISTWDVIDLGKKIRTITEKKLITEVSFDQLSELEGVEDIWVNFSGGKSYAELEKSQLLNSSFEIEG